MGLQAGRLIKAIRNAFLLVVAVAMLSIGATWSIITLANTDAGKIFIICSPVIIAFGILVKVCYDFEVDR